MAESPNVVTLLLHSRKVILAAIGIVVIAVMVTASRRDWTDLAAPVIAIAGIVGTLVNAIAKEDAAGKAGPMAVGRDNIQVVKSAPPPPFADAVSPTIPPHGKVPRVIGSATDDDPTFPLP